MASNSKKETSLVEIETGIKGMRALCEAATPDDRNLSFRLSHGGISDTATRTCSLCDEKRVYPCGLCIHDNPLRVLSRA